MPEHLYINSYKKINYNIQMYYMLFNLVQVFLCIKLTIQYLIIVFYLSHYWQKLFDDTYKSNLNTVYGIIK